MKCRDIMNSNLEQLAEHDSIETAAIRMATAGVGFLPICDGAGKAVGVVTDRDVATRAVAKKLTPASTSVGLIMTSPAITCPASADLREAERLMAEEQKSRIVVVDEDGRAVGVVSLVDLIEHAPARQALRTAKAVLWRDALGPRGGALPGDPLLKDDPVASAQPPSGDAAPTDTVFTGGHWRLNDTKEFPGS
jgi:CBS domain-containing protein